MAIPPSIAKQDYERLKTYQKKLKGLETELKDTNQILSDLDARRKQLWIEVEQTKSAIRALEMKAPKETVISEHAVLRYLERKLGMNIDEVRSEIKNQVQGFDPTLGEAKVSGFVIKNNTIVTYEGNL